MTGLQRIIKYLALAFAACLIFGILSGIAQCFGWLLSAFGLTDDSVQSLAEDSTFAVDGDVSELDISLTASSLHIARGDCWSVTTDSGYVTVSQAEGTLKVREKSRFTRFHAGKTHVVLTVPDDTELKRVSMESGAGRVQIDALSTEVLYFELGAGEAKVDHLTVTKQADIEGGAGEITLRHAALNHLELNMGVGELSLNAALTGKSSIDFGVGSARLMLDGAKEDYSISLDKGIGEATLDGEQMKDGETYGRGANILEMDGGIGEIVIKRAG